MKRFSILILCVLLSGCSIFKNELNRTITKTTTKTIEQIIDEKVALSLQKELPKAINQGIGDYVVNYGPYGLSTLLLALLTKMGMDLRKKKKYELV